MHDFKLSLHTWTLGTTPLSVSLDAAAKAGFGAVELRRVDFVQCYEKGMSRPEVVELVRRSGLQLGVLGTEYGWFFATPEEQKRLFAVMHETCEIAVELGCKVIMSAPGQTTGSLRQAIAATRIAGEIVGEFGLRLALEFNSQHPVVNQTPVLQEIIAAAGHAHCGLLLDAYHLYRSQGIARGLDGVSAAELFAFQYSDVPLAPKPARRPIDRLAPGDGVVEWADLFMRLRKIGYNGYLSYEAPNPAFWTRSPYDVCAEGFQKTQTLLAADIGVE